MFVREYYFIPSSTSSFDFKQTFALTESLASLLLNLSSIFWAFRIASSDTRVRSCMARGLLAFLRILER